jgi:hypothetical protein
MNKMILLSAIALLALATTAGRASAAGSVFGQWQPPSPLDGAWQLSVTPYNCATGEEFPFFSVRSDMTIASGGTLVETNSNPDFQPGQRSSGLGFWERTGRKTYHAYVQAFLLFDTVDPPPPPARSYLRGTQSFDHSIEMQDANHWTSKAVVTFSDLSGATVYGSGCAKAVAERMQ